MKKISRPSILLLFCGLLVVNYVTSIPEVNPNFCVFHYVKDGSVQFNKMQQQILGKIKNNKGIANHKVWRFNPAVLTNNPKEAWIYLNGEEIKLKNYKIKESNDIANLEKYKSFEWEDGDDYINIATVKGVFHLGVISYKKTGFLIHNLGENLVVICELQDIK